jgi:hypothetical protein
MVHKDLEGNGHGIFEGVTLAFYGKTEENHEAQSG